MKKAVLIYLEKMLCKAMKKIFLLLVFFSTFMIFSITASASNFPSNFQELQYLNGNQIMPSTGKVRGLVVPVLFENQTQEDKNQMLNTLDFFFNGTDYNNLSVSHFYNISSNEKLELTFEIYNPFQLSRSYLDYERTVLGRGSSLIVQEFLNNTEVNLAEFDSTDDGFVDAIYIIYNRPFERDHHFWEAFTTEYVFSQTNHPTRINNFVFMSYNFFLDYGASYAIRETGRLLGINAFEHLRGEDVMDGMFGDHNPLNKLLLGWINPIICYQSCDRNLRSLQNGELILVTDRKDFDINYDLFTEFILIDYFDINAQINRFGRTDVGFQKSGIRLLSVNIMLYGNERNGFHFNNQLVELISRNFSANLIEFTNNDDLFNIGDLIRPEEYSQLLSSTMLDLGFNIEIKSYEPNLHFNVLVHFVNESPYAPRIEGVQDFEVRINDRIDFLAGVKAFDYHGRPIEELFLSGTFPINIPGTYRMGVIAYDEDGNKAVSHFMVTVTTSANFRNVYITLVVCLGILATIGLISFVFHRHRREILERSR